ncbi:hypothetical protein PLICRDRAFT_102751 [Plicaturopsis crispa FD-325 SS-3]|nr:hypothetical protein PLICRDRAFT_102751 [Plicaturopsis crispa FD-325 SS-3]
MHHTQIHSFDPRAGWKWHESRPKLPLSSIVLVPDIKDLLLADLKDFTNGQQWYEERGIPFRRGYLLHGARGSGKSSLVYAIAAEMARDVCVLSLGTGTHGISDMEFYESLQQIPPNSILLIEDIDVTLHHAARKDGTALSEQPSHAPSGVGEEASLVQQLTVDGIIKALDSLVSTEGCISFTTCTHLEWVDPSLSRSGRMDVWLEFKDATQWQAEELFCNVFATQYGFGDSVELGAQGERQLDEVGITKLARRFADTIPHEQLSIATLREYLLKHRFDPESAVSDALAWVASELLLRRQAQSI